MEMPNNNTPANPFDSNGTNTTVASGGLGALKTVANNINNITNNGTNSETNNETNNGTNSVVQNLINKSKKKKRTSVAMTQLSYDKIVTLAMSNDISVSSVVELIIEEAVNDVDVNNDLVELFNKKENKKKNKIKKAKKNKAKVEEPDDDLEEDEE